MSIDAGGGIGNIMDTFMNSPTILLCMSEGKKLNILKNMTFHDMNSKRIQIMDHDIYITCWLRFEKDVLSIKYDSIGILQSLTRSTLTYFPKSSDENIFLISYLALQ